MPPLLTETEHGWVLPAAGLPLTQFCIDHAFSLRFWQSNQAYAEVRLETLARLVRAGRTYDLEPSAPVTLTPAFALFMQTVQSAVADRDGTLRLVFADGSVLTAPPDQEYEAWNFTGSEGWTVISLPGGSLGIF